MGYSPSSDFAPEPIVAHLHWLGYVYTLLTFCLLLFSRSVVSDFFVVQVAQFGTPWTAARQTSLSFPISEK